MSPWNRDSHGDLQRLLAHALPDMDAEDAIQMRSEPELGAIVSLAHCIVEDINRQLATLGSLMGESRCVQDHTVQTLGYMIRSLTEQQSIALELSAMALQAICSQKGNTAQSDAVFIQ